MSPNIRPSGSSNVLIFGFSIVIHLYCHTQFRLLPEKILQFSKDRDWEQFHTPENLAKSIAIESGELLECFQWDAEHFDKKAVCEELADVANYCVLMADSLGVDLNEIILEKLEQNAKKYPIEKAKGSAKKYTEL